MLPARGDILYTAAMLHTDPATIQANAAPASDRADLAITGMTCAACASLIERRLRKLPGVQSASVNFATARAAVEYNAKQTDPAALIARVNDSGYGASLAVNFDNLLNEDEQRQLRNQFLLSLLLSLPVIVLAMAHGAKNQ